MTNIREIFKNDNIDKLSEDYWQKDVKICWYPSSWYDFRHIIFWYYLKIHNNKSFPEVIIHTDFDCLNFNPFPKDHLGFFERRWALKENFPNPVLHKYYILERFGKTVLFNLSYVELFPKEDIFYLSKNILYENKKIFGFTHRIFAIECKIMSFTNEEWMKVGFNRKGKTRNNIFDNRYFPEGVENIHNFLSYLRENNESYKKTEKETRFLLLWFSMENSNFFFDIILKNNIKIDYITHINDGGGAGFCTSRLKTDYIYRYYDYFQPSKILIDKRFINLFKSNEYRNGIEYFNPITKISSNNYRLGALDIEKFNEDIFYFPDSKGIFIASNPNTGHIFSNYSDFKTNKIHKNEYYLYERKNSL